MPFISGKKVIIISVLFVLLWFFTDLIWMIIDPQVLTRSAGPETDQYWHWLYLTSYFRQMLPWAILATIIPVKNRFAKGAFLTISFMHLYAMFDLVLAGNHAGSIWEPFAILSALAYTSIVWYYLWRVSPISDPIEAGRVYIISRPPSTLLELIGSWTFARWDGSALIMSGSMTYGFNKQGVFEKIHHAKFKLRPNQIAKLVPDAVPYQVDINANDLIGKPWRWNCFSMVRKLLK